MALKDIISEIAADEGIPIDTTAERAYLLDIINKAAKEIYNTYDLRGSLREQIFNIGDDQQLITLPWYVDKVRAVRQYDYRFPVNYNNMQQRYHVNAWQIPLLDWREVQQEAPLQRDIENEGYLTITLSQAAAAPVTFIVTGKTPNAERLVEMVTFVAGDLTKNTSNNWESIISIRKNTVIDENATITDLDGNTIAFIPNSELKSRNTIVQVLDRWQNEGEDVLVEVLFKHRFTPFVADTDILPCGEIYDRCIYWKTISQLYSKQEGEAAFNKTIGADGKCRQLIEEITNNDNTGKVQMLDMAPNPMLGMFTRNDIYINDQYPRP